MTLGVLEPGPNALVHTLGGMAEAADFLLRTPTLTASNFAALQSTHPKFLAIKDLLFFSQRIEFQGLGTILKVIFALSNSPHLHRAYLVTVCKLGAMAVFRSSVSSQIECRNSVKI